MREIKYINSIKRSDSIGNLIKESRQAKGLRLSDVARRSGLTESAISRYEKGNRVPNYESLMKIMDALDIDIVLITTDSN